MRGLVGDNIDLKSRMNLFESLDTTIVSDLLDAVDQLKQAKKRKMQNVAVKLL